MSWSIQQLAHASGVTPRTLRYYDEIDLLHPARVGENGYRYYEREQLLRLQQILLYRELGLNLNTIAGVIDDEHDPEEALRAHHCRLVAERDRLGRLTRTVAATLQHLQEGTDMPTADMFRSMTPERAEYLAGLPKKRTAAGVLLRNEDGRTLLMEPNYKPYWQLPGCVVGADESPLSATIRAVRERLGLSIAPGRLLVTDWVAPTESRIEGLLFVYDGVTPLVLRSVREDRPGPGLPELGLVHRDRTRRSPASPHAPTNARSTAGTRRRHITLSRERVDRLRSRQAKSNRPLDVCLRGRRLNVASQTAARRARASRRHPART